MTIKIEAWQSRGIKTDKCIDKFEFCCWDELDRWLHRPNIIPHKCPTCKEIGVPKLSRQDVAKVINLLQDKIEKANPKELQEALNYMNSRG